MTSVLGPFGRLGRFGSFRTRLAGIEIEIQLVFVAWLGVIGIAAGRNDVTLVTWILVAGGGVLIHELGHALAYRAFGVEPRIVLSAVFGLTYGDALPPARSVAVSMAGPATGLAIGIVGLALAAVLGPSDGLIGVVIGDLQFVGFGWAVLNVLPVQPLDGGQALRDALVATGRRDADRLALLVSIAAAAGIAIVAAASNYFVLIVFMAWFAASNLEDLRTLSDDRLRGRLNTHARRLMEGDSDGAIAGFEEVQRTAQSRSVAEAALAGRAFAFLAVGRWQEADAAHSQLTGPSSERLLRASIALHHGHLDPGLAALLAERSDAISAMGTARALVDTARLDDVLAQVPLLTDGESLRARRTLLVGLHFDGFHEAAVDIGEALFAQHPILNEVAYFVSSSLAALGRTEESLAWLERAVDQGARHVSYLDRDENFAELRSLPGFTAIRDRIVGDEALRPQIGELLGDSASDVGARG